MAEAMDTTNIGTRKWLRITAKAVGLSFLLLIAHTGSLYLASELGGEVVILEKSVAPNETRMVRLWIVEDSAIANVAWIEHGDKSASWIQQLSEDPIITLTRDQRTLQYHATLDEAAHDLMHRLRRAKYGWADRFIELLFGKSSETCTDATIRLVPTA